MENCNCCTTYSAPDLMDGGVAAALIEQEVAGSYTRTDEEVDPRKTVEFWKGAANIAKRRAEKAEEERDEWEKIALTAERDADEAEEDLLAFKAAQAFRDPRPLTADDITIATAQALIDAYKYYEGYSPLVRVLNALAAVVPALTEPTRPEGADEIEADMAAWYGENGMPIGGTGDRLADHLAAMGYRKGA